MAGRHAEKLSAGNVSVPDRGGPTVVRLVLGTQLRRLREAGGISRDTAGDEIRASQAKISRIERGQVRLKPRDVSDLLTLYGVTSPEERARFLELTESANTPGWWHGYSDVLPPWFEPYIGLEEAAALIRAYEVQFVPGLVQTADYARAVIRLAYPKASDSELDSRVDMRMRRQERLLDPDAPHLWAVIDEAALRRPHGGPETMRAQLTRILELTDLPNVTLQIVPFEQGGHPAAGGPFSILRFTEPQLPDVVYLEQLDSASYVDKPDDTHLYMEVMDRLCVQSPPPSATPDLLRRLRENVPAPNSGTGED